MSDGYVTVRIGRVPGTITEIALNGGRQVSDAIEAAGLDAGGCEIRVNDSPAGPSTVLEDGDTVFLLKKIRGAA